MFFADQAWQACAKIKDAEIQALKGQLSTHQKSEFHPDWSMLEACQDSLREHMGIINLRDAEIERLHARVAMLSEALEFECGDRCNAEYNPCSARQAINATEADVTKWVNGMRANAVVEYLKQAQETMSAKLVR
jgi:hypothetical protein